MMGSGLLVSSFALSWHGMAFLFLLVWRRHFAAGGDPPLIRRRPGDLLALGHPYSLFIPYSLGRWGRMVGYVGRNPERRRSSAVKKVTSRVPHRPTRRH